MTSEVAEAIGKAVDSSEGVGAVVVVPDAQGSSVHGVVAALRVVGTVVVEETVVVVAFVVGIATSKRRSSKSGPLFACKIVRNWSVFYKNFSRLAFLL